MHKLADLYCVGSRRFNMHETIPEAGRSNDHPPVIRHLCVLRLSSRLIIYLHIPLHWRSAETN